MIKTTCCALILLFSGVDYIKANNPDELRRESVELTEDSLRLVELDSFWAALARTVHEGDFEGYKASCHEKSVVVFTSGKNKVSHPMSTALEGWEPGFDKTKAGEQQDNVEFRFSQRIGDETTAHETGVFHFTSADSEGNVIVDQYIHFEALLIKEEGVWQTLMEYQKAVATQEEWEELK